MGEGSAWQPVMEPCQRMPVRCRRPVVRQPPPDGVFAKEGRKRRIREPPVQGIQNGDLKAVGCPYKPLGQVNIIPVVLFGPQDPKQA